MSVKPCGLLCPVFVAMIDGRATTEEYETHRREKARLWDVALKESADATAKELRSFLDPQPSGPTGISASREASVMRHRVVGNEDANE